MLQSLLTADGQIATLIIDDADHVSASSEMTALLATIIALPAKLRVVLASRRELDVPLARHEANGDLLRITPVDMLFDKDERNALLGDGMSDDGSETDTLLGWPLGFALQARMGASAPRSGEFDITDAAPRQLSGNWRIIEDYFSEEILPALDGETLEFLVKASILQKVKVEECGELFGIDGAGLLRRAYLLGVPLWPDDFEHQCYTILPAFQQFLRARLSACRAKELGAKACDLLQRSRDYSGASSMALELGEHERAAELIERQMKSDFGLRDETRLLTLAQRINPDVRNAYPRILLAQTQALIFKFEFEQARRLLESARLIVERKAGDGQSDPAEIRTLEMLLLHREMVLALGQHDLPAAQERGNKLLSGLDDVPPMQCVMLLASLIYAQQELYIFRGADRYYAQAKKLVASLDSWIWSVPLETFYARHLFQTGRTTAAIDLLEATLKRLVEELGPRPVLGSIAAIALAEMKFEIGEVDEADQLLIGYSDSIEHFGYLSLIIAARVTRARILILRGDYDEGFAILERPAIAAGELFESLNRSLGVERYYWLLRLSREDTPRLTAPPSGLSLSHPLEPHSSAGKIEEAQAGTWIQLARVSRRFNEAILVAQKWQRYSEGVGAVRSNVRWHITLACLRTLAEEPRFAMRHLRRAVKLAAGCHYRAAFLSELDLLRGQLMILSDSDLDEAEKAFVRSIVGVTEKKAVVEDTIDLTLPLGTFSSREVAILRLVAKGHTNREIGVTLGMTEGTVKWYLHRIYDVLGIRRRSQVAMIISKLNAGSFEFGEDADLDDMD
ncbi:MAG: hypothetical protein J0G94_18850 [Sphingomonadales bacterium]|nr:hypothetical protein [Sphingomonadales bacterium]